MKKSDFILIGLVLVIVVLAMFSTKGNIVEEKIKFPIKLSGEIGVNEITYSEYKEKVENGENFVVIISSEGCGYCAAYMPIITKYANDKKIAITYIDISKLSIEDKDNLINSNKYLKKNRWGTPTTLLMVGNRVVDVIDGMRDENAINEFFKDKVVFGE